MTDKRSNEAPENEVLTLQEAATYLKVSFEDMLRLAESNRVPAQKIGEDWRFLKLALSRWLEMGRPYSDLLRSFPPHVWFSQPLMEEWLNVLKDHISEVQLNQEMSNPPKGSYEAISPFIGIFSGKEDPEEAIAQMRKIRDWEN
jgi:excisionase family DNA binding protein